MSTLHPQNRQAVGINRSILDCISTAEHIPRGFDLPDMQDQIRDFLVEEDLLKREGLAIPISKQALTKHKKDGSLHPFISNLAEIEKGVQVFNKDLRDHITHSLYVYLLGLMFIEKEAWLFGNVDPLTWKISSLLHDIGYPLEWFSRSTRDYLDMVFKHAPNTLNPNGIEYGVSIRGLEKLKFCTVDGFQVIKDRLGDWGIVIDVRNLFESDLARGSINHGVLSSLIVLRVVDHLYSQMNPRRETVAERDGVDWGKSCFDRQIIDAVAAVALHNILDHVDKIDLQSSPIAYLLVLCDTIQQWNRYSPKKKVYDPHSVELEFEPHLIQCRMAVDERDLNETQHVLHDILTSEDLMLGVYPLDD